MNKSDIKRIFYISICSLLFWLLGIFLLPHFNYISSFIYWCWSFIPIIWLFLIGIFFIKSLLKKRNTKSDIDQFINLWFIGLWIVGIADFVFHIHWWWYIDILELWTAMIGTAYFLASIMILLTAYIYVSWIPKKINRFKKIVSNKYFKIVIYLLLLLLWIYCIYNWIYWGLWRS
jgi:hypothetical protein